MTFALSMIGFHLANSARWIGVEGGGLHLLRRRDVLAEILQLAADLGVLQRGDGGGVQLGDDLRRRALGRPQAVPDRDLDAGKPASAVVGMSGAAAGALLAVTA